MILWRHLGKESKGASQGSSPRKSNQAERTVGAKALRQKAVLPGSQSSREVRTAEQCEQGRGLRGNGLVVEG